MHHVSKNANRAQVNFMPSNVQIEGRRAFAASRSNAGLGIDAIYLNNDALCQNLFLLWRGDKLCIARIIDDCDGICSVKLGKRRVEICDKTLKSIKRS